MGCLFRLLLLLIFVGAPVAGVVLALDREPVVAGTRSVGPAELRQAMMIGARLAMTRPTGEGSRVTLSASELDLLVRSWAARAPNTEARAAVSRFGAAIGATVTLPLPPNPVGRYVNIRATVAPSREGLQVDRLAIGAIEVPRPLIRPIVSMTLDMAGDNMGETVYDSVKSVSVAGDSVTIGLALSPAALGAAAGGLAGGTLPSTGNPRIDAMIRNASPADRERVMRAIRETLGGDAGAQQKAMQALQQRFGGQLPAGSEQILRELQRSGGKLPDDPQQAIKEIKRRLANDPAARDRAIQELKRRQGTP